MTLPYPAKGSPGGGWDWNFEPILSGDAFPPPAYLAQINSAHWLARDSKKAFEESFSSNGVSELSIQFKAGNDVACDCSGTLSISNRRKRRYEIASRDEKVIAKGQATARRTAGIKRPSLGPHGGLPPVYSMWRDKYRDGKVRGQRK
jgi:hypothetical protein